MNLLKETIDILKEHGKRLEDIRFISTSKGDFVPSNGGRKFLDVEYDDPWSIDQRLKIVGDDWWLERYYYECDGWWEFKQIPRFGNHSKEFLTPFA